MAITTLTVKVQIENQNEFIMVLVVFLEILYGFSGVKSRPEREICVATEKEPKSLSIRGKSRPTGEICVWPLKSFGNGMSRVAVKSFGSQ